MWIPTKKHGRRSRSWVEDDGLFRFVGQAGPYHRRRKAEKKLENLTEKRKTWEKHRKTMFESFERYKDEKSVDVFRLAPFSFGCTTEVPPAPLSATICHYLNLPGICNHMQSVTETAAHPRHRRSSAKDLKSSNSSWTGWTEHFSHGGIPKTVLPRCTIKENRHL